MIKNREPKRFAFYGSLRLGEYNYNRLLKNQMGVKYIKTITIPEGYLMYSLGPYPMVIKDESSKLPLVLDLFEIDNDRISEWIDLMEIGAGYTQDSIFSHITDTNENLEWCLYVGEFSENARALKSANIVTSGDWTVELQKRREKEIEYNTQ